MSVPIKTFWLMNDSINRISAKEDLRSLTVASSCQSFDGATSHHERLIFEVGTTVKLEVDPIREAVRDETGFAELKNMANQ